MNPGNVIALFDPRPADILAGQAVPMPRAARRDRMNFADVARELCLDQFRRDETIIDKLRSLHRYAAMPLPENNRFVKGRPCKGADNICKSSIWLRGPFMAWKNSRHGDADANRHDRDRSARRLTENAARLAGGTGA